MKGKTVFYLDLFRKLDEHNVRYVLVGGLAMNLHGVPRMTMDVDVLLAMDASNLNAFISAAQELGLKPRLPVPVEQLKDPRVREEWITQRNMIAFPLGGGSVAVPTVDVLIRHSLDFDVVYSRALVREANGVPIRFASADDMVAMKKDTGRRQDAADIEQLRRFKGD